MFDGYKYVKGEVNDFIVDVREHEDNNKKNHVVAFIVQDHCNEEPVVGIQYKYVDPERTISDSQVVNYAVARLLSFYEENGLENSFHKIIRIQQVYHYDPQAVRIVVPEVKFKEDVLSGLSDSELKEKYNINDLVLCWARKLYHR